MSEDVRDAALFLDALAGGEDMPEPERMILCGFGDDPNAARSSAWRPRPWRPGREIVLHESCNAYVTVSSFFRAGDGSFRRRNECFAAGRALMVDDVGTKVPMERMLKENGEPLLRPSAIVETSPGNFQWWYILREPERDVVRFDGVIRAFIMGKLLGMDPGMSGVTRVGRIPGFLNTKPANRTKHSPLGWRVELRDLNRVRYTVDQLLGGFELRINGQRIFRDKLVTEDAILRNRAWLSAYRWLKAYGMLKKTERDPSGWFEMRCPWTEDHSGKADTGAAIREPALENDYYGAFRCHHGHCADKGWAELTEWISDQAGENLDRVNDAWRNAEMPQEMRQ